MKMLLSLLTIAAAAQCQTLPLSQLEVKNLKPEPVEYKGRAAVRLVETVGAEADGQLAILKGQQLKDGTIEVWLAGEPGPGAGAAARGFVGVAFRVRPDGSRYEAFYLRPTNGRADDQVRRNHSAQYISHPDHHWQRLRTEFPKKYETYVDLVPGEWTKVMITVQGDKARLYVHDATQPTLVVNDLFLGTEGGGVAIWVGPGTIAHFAGLKVTAN